MDRKVIRAKVKDLISIQENMLIDILKLKDGIAANVPQLSPDDIPLCRMLDMWAAYINQIHDTLKETVNNI